MLTKHTVVIDKEKYDVKYSTVPCDGCHFNIDRPIKCHDMVGDHCKRFHCIYIKHKNKKHD